MALPYVEDLVMVRACRGLQVCMEDWGEEGDVRSWLRLSGWGGTGDDERKGDDSEARVGRRRGHTLLDLRCLGYAPLKYEGYQREEARIVVRYDL